MTSRRLVIVVVAALLTVAALAAPTAASGHVFQANMTTEAENQDVVDSNANGHATFWVTDDGIAFTLKVSRLSGPAWGAHIHGPAGPDANGGIRARLCGNPAVSAGGECSTDDGGKLRVSGTITADNLAGVTMDELLALMAAGMAYVNVHTDLNGAGEVRGQVR